MNQTLALLCGVDPMLDDLKVKAGCISIRRSHAPADDTNLDIANDTNMMMMYQRLFV